MPQKGQITVTLSKKNIPKRVGVLINEYHQSFSLIVTMCLMFHYGNKKEKAMANKWIEVFGK